MQQETQETNIKKIEIAMWFTCNCGCVFCSSRDMGEDRLGTRDIERMLSDYRERGVTKVDFGGGEPTVRKDIPRLVEHAVSLGYKQIGIKSNGMRFCYPEYVETCMSAGVNEFFISLWGHDAATHDRLAGRDRAFEATEMGLKNLVDAGADVEVDFLVSTLTVPHMADAAKWLTESIGVKRISLWLFSIFGAGGGMAEMLPPMSDAAREALRARDAVSGDVAIRTTHIMPCLLNGREDMYYNIKDIGLQIITPGGSFAGEDSPFEKGSHIAACSGCRMEQVCAGPRREYLDIFGDPEFRTIK